MISVTESVFGGAFRLQLQRYTCVCGQLHKWSPTTQQSPYMCLGGCSKTLPDITKLTRDLEWRVAYHLGGREAVRCGAFL